MKLNVSLLTTLALTNRRRCPESGVLAAFVDEALDEKERVEVRRHLIQCDSCFESVSHLLELKDQPVPDLPVYLERKAKQLGKRRPDVAVPAFGWRLAGSLAVLCVAVALGIGYWNSSEPSAPLSEPSGGVRVVRGAASTRPSFVLKTPAAGDVLERGSTDFSWEEVSDATAYRVSVVDLEGSLIWQNRFGPALSAVAPEASLEPGTYYASVEALMPDGRVARTDFVRFEVREQDAR